MKKEEFKILANEFNVIPVYERVTGDMLTPVLAFLKLREKEKFCFLLESVEGIGRLARYSFIGKDPHKIISNRNRKLKIYSNNNDEVLDENLFDYLKTEIASYKFPIIEDLPDFTGGIVGYIGYENISLIEDKLKFDNHENSETPDSILGIFNTIIAFDHYKHQLLIISNVHLNGNSDLDVEFEIAKQKIAKVKAELTTPISYKSDFSFELEEDNDFNSSKFFDVVEKAKQNIYNGDVFQLVLSKRFTADYKGDLLNLYRALRIINPSPYMYFMELPEEITVVGTSPEDLIKVQNRKASILPIAGTRKRGNTNEKDLMLEKELLADPKELAEHIMLVDLARNDLGRVCKFKTIDIKDYMNIHRFSHVMHIVSRVEGELEEDKDSIDAFKAAFPAGTVSGAPKIRAMELINEYENSLRNIYAGAVGYIDFRGNLDMCIAIRTLFAIKNKIHWQAGAGIVADSKPELELKEINNKAAVLLKALEYAGEIDEPNR
ncbi:MAG: anthranilate synthase component I [Bacteroidetes bacterium]|nr:anthranilate synthase component I [Bacteroidota bacterium]MBU1115786.1 anthranilate synthase component I [Bacteroidota bacterium]MBU1798532.1 anthranilate synthase component I [Bacteroidota bacterium]